MNYLAHIYLSGDNELVKIGNFMADGIRGKHYETLHPDIQKGVLLHREIDMFTDQHPVFRKGTKRLHERYHHYSGVIMDIFYDHFLSKNWQKYSPEKLGSFIDNFYDSLERNYDQLTEKTKGMMPYMIKYNWLWSYQFPEGIQRILTQMDQRSRTESNMRFASEELSKYYTLFEQEFTEFFEDLRAHAAKTLAGL
ncbi:acyl carrier protein phosphodiesterase [Flavobacterium silvaticum]|uniref:DUF479 domain-containing protein n=1 Tax=Flavobacterium silvaticum TaxID=1852020 RepID=A0A972FVJ8_9FLAO|nr:acyl carrier protein phosphodiesterase [Flavobacterium silvaticum]NMH28822.1 DUF479 domain-containing protein [Flavobacterium silvaticum]